MDGSVQYIVLVILLMLSAFFSAAETSLTSLSKIRLINMLEEDVKGAKRVDKLLKSQKKLLSSILVGNNLANIGASAIATSIAIELSGNSSLAITISTGITTLLILIFGEITPKTIASQKSEQVALSIAPLANIFFIIFTPFVTIINFITSFFIKMFGGTDKENPIITEAELKTLVNVGQEEGIIELEEKEMISNVFDFGDTHASDIMTRRTDIVAVNVEATFEEIVDIFKYQSFTRIPVYRNTTDDIIGVIHLRDFAFKSTNDFDITNIMRKPHYTYESKKTASLFEEMRAEKTQITVVIDEYGATSGIISFEDLIEEIVGEIEDEYDKIIPEIDVVKEDEYLVKGSTQINMINKMIGTNLESEDFDSIGGYIMGIVSRIPDEGEIIKKEEITFVIESVCKNKIDLIRIFT